MTRPAQLDWSAVIARYHNGADVDTLPGGAKITVSGADDEYVYVKHRLWKASLSRANLERGVDLVAAGTISNVATEFIDQYRTLVADERSTVAATILKDLGYLI